MTGTTNFVNLKILLYFVDFSKTTCDIPQSFSGQMRELPRLTWKRTCFLPSSALPSLSAGSFSPLRIPHASRTKEMSQS
jgi:hypothetical protein